MKSLVKSKKLKEKPNKKKASSEVSFGGKNKLIKNKKKPKKISKKLAKKVVKTKVKDKIVKKKDISKIKTKLKIKEKEKSFKKQKSKSLVKKKTVNLRTSKKKKVIKKLKNVKGNKVGEIKLRRSSGNPIISPSFYSWESRATFNPTAIEIDGKIYIIYRAIGDDDSSVLGCAISENGLDIDTRSTYCIYKRFLEYNKSGTKIDYISGGGWSGGAEDPRVVLIDGRVYVIYTAFDGWNSVRLALTSISLNDFKNKKWKWKKEVMISPPGEIHKNWVIFPEKINGKFAILHSISPDIKVDYFDSLDELDGKKFIKSFYHKKPNWSSEISWDNEVRGVGPIPIRTKIGWLVLYHAMDKKDPHKYKLGAMILDFKDPTKILYRAQNPILEPEEEYEKEGYRGIVYCCGAVVKNGNLIVYYGGADKYVCVAEIPFEKFLNSLIDKKEIKLKNIRK